MTTPLLSNPNIFEILACNNDISTPHAWMLWVAYIKITYHFLHHGLMYHHPIHLLKMLQTYPFRLIPLNTILHPCYSTMFAIIKIYFFQFLKCYGLGDVLGESTLWGVTLSKKMYFFWIHFGGNLWLSTSSSFAIIWIIFGI